VERARPRWLLAACAGLGAGLVAAALYAAISAAMDREILYLIIAVGFVAGIVVARVAKVASPVTAAIAFAVGAFSVAAAIYLYEAAQLWGSLPEALSHIGDASLGTTFDVYFSDPLGYVWAAAGIITALLVGLGILGGGTNTTAGTTDGQPVQHATPLTPPEG